MYYRFLNENNEVTKLKNFWNRLQPIGRGWGLFIPMKDQKRAENRGANIVRQTSSSMYIHYCATCYVFLFCTSTSTAMNLSSSPLASTLHCVSKYA